MFKRYNRVLLLSFAVLGGLLLKPLALMAETCPPTAPYCSKIKSCNQALYYLEVCGFTKLDRDQDGIPCESICGQKLSPALQAMKDKLKSTPPALGLVSQPAVNSFICHGRVKCSELKSCEEARFQLNKCGQKHLDGDKDGMPCNRLCK